MSQKFYLYALALVGCCLVIAFVIAVVFQLSRSGRLIDAIRNGRKVEVRRLLRQGAPQVNRREQNGNTALLYAFEARDKDIFKMILEAGGDPSICNQAGECVMNLSARESDSYWLIESIAHGGNVDVINLGNRHSPGSTPIFYAIHEENTENIAILIKNSANLNHRDCFGHTPLREAAGTGNYQAVVLLLEAGADPLIADNNGEDLTHWFDGRDESLVLDEHQIPWFKKARDILARSSKQAVGAKESQPPCTPPEE